VAKSYQPLVAFVLLAVSLAVYAYSAATLSAEYRYQILDLVSAYSYMYDGKDLEGYLALYSKDCVWEVYASGVCRAVIGKRRSTRSSIYCVTRVSADVFRAAARRRSRCRGGCRRSASSIRLVDLHIRTREQDKRHR
jgi:hypothetical protein